MVQQGSTAQAVMAILNARAAQASVAPFSAYDLRRTFAGEMLDAGVDLATLQQMMGQANPATTARYDRRDNRARQAAIKSVEQEMKILHPGIWGRPD